MRGKQISNIDIYICDQLRGIEYDENKASPQPRVVVVEVVVDR